VSLKVVLVNAPSDHLAAARNKLGLWIPGEQLGICYLAATLRRDGHTVELIDAFLSGLSPDEVISQVLQHSRDADVVGLSISDGKVLGAVRVLEGLEDLPPHSHLALGGHTATLCAKEFLQDHPRVDSVIIGEGEWTLPELCKRIERGTEWRDLRGLAARVDGKIVKNAVAPLVDLDSLPFPARDNLRLCERAGFAISMETSRGCKGVCSFCATRMMFDPDRGPTWRARSAESILEEVEYLIRDYDVRRISFEDEDFLGFGGKAGNTRAIVFAEEVLRRGLKFTWSTLTRVDNVEHELFALLKRAGLQLIFIGAENSDQKILNRYRKGISSDQNRRAVEILKSLDLPHQLLWIMYDPYTDFSSLGSNVRFFEDYSTALNINLDNSLRVYHGTPLHSRLARESRIRGSYLEYEYDIPDPKVRAFREAMTVGLNVPFALIKKLNDVLWNRVRWDNKTIEEARALAEKLDSVSKAYVRQVYDRIAEDTSVSSANEEIRAQTLTLALETAALAASLTA
jgi:radical SAM superfamily enzyme YgiQ (UPF0313 family)